MGEMAGGCQSRAAFSWIPGDAALRVEGMKTLLAAVLFLSACQVYAGDSNGALACLNALPEKYRNGVLKLSADNANPNPATWYVVAQGAGNDAGMRNLTVASGEVTSDKPALGLRQIFSSDKPIDLSKVTIDSRDAFDIAQRYANANGKTIASVSFVLNQKGSSAVPIWSVWCYGPSENYFGEMQLLATDGTVISNDAFPKAPSAW